MPLTVNELNNGITYWNNTPWPRDFHNAFYQQMAALNPNGNFTADWWGTFVRILGQWRALRPRSRAFLTERAVNRFGRLSEDWNNSILPVMAFDITDIQWPQISSFPAIVAEIKDVFSPVFTSKFCHFLAPHIFPVIDNAAMGNPFLTYERYFLFGQSEWRDTPTDIRNDLIDILQDAIGPNLIHNYPIKCKIIELCLIGRHNFQ